jgi:hypothetical protein
MKTFIVYNLDSKMPVAVGEQVSAETARYCASEITGTFHTNLFAEEIDLEKKLRRYTRIGRLFLKSCAEFAATARDQNRTRANAWWRAQTRIADCAEGGAGAAAEHGATKHGVRQMIAEDQSSIRFAVASRCSTGSARII